MHLVNNLSDSSISRIVLDIISLSGILNYDWYVGSLAGRGEMSVAMEKSGAVMLDFSGKYGKARLNEDMVKYQVQILHSHTPRSTIDGWRSLSMIPARSRPKHAATKHLLTGIKDRRWGLIYTIIDYLSLYIPDNLMPVSKTMAKQISRLPLMNSGRVVAIPNGISLAKFADSTQRAAIRMELSIAPTTIVFGFAGRLDQVKRIDLLLPAFQSVHNQYPDTKLLILGEGQMQATLVQIANELRISDSVIWAGFRNDMPGMLAAMDIYVQPSDNEGLSLSILEAMAARRPVITTRVGAADEVLVNHVTGCIVPPGSIPDLQKEMVFLIKNPEVMQSIAEAAYREVCDHYSTNSMVAAYQNIYSRLIVKAHHE
jgi:glycosyltransferase involved in cell wall biosynthesis